MTVSNYLSADTLALIQRADAAFSRSADFSLISGIIALTRTGSHSYGTNTPESDEDYTAVVIPRMRHLVGLGQWDHWEPGADDKVDMKAMAVAKFVKLAAHGNPNIVEMLFLSPEDYLLVLPPFQRLLDHREAFLSKNVYRRFSGYAYGQLQKMEQGKTMNYMGHKRKELVAKLGYDPKDASHCIRLLYKGGELVRQGTLTPRLTGEERRIVMAIKNGEWSLDEVKVLAKNMASANEAWFTDPQCALQDEPDTDFIEILLMEIQREALR